ncbi:hypothetical protein FB471_5379 [Amycolatopsis cihanbeyliensis]|uniref:Uncharacterized protein n=2 Tax=Amycolatopsis cihanbeyliensis TaxID=1128664 RepID=A0A542DR22_AMYCI|nr:hypothetical protein FB471_5379 [Amycolatopsis cihanbeyliensis]
MSTRRTPALARAVAVCLALCLVGALSVASGSAAPRPAQRLGAADAPSDKFPEGSGIKAGYWVEDTVSRIEKLRSEITIGQGTFNALVNPAATGGTIRGLLDLPEADSYFVTFGIMPVTSTVQLIQDGEAEGTVQVSFRPDPDNPDKNWMRAEADVTAKVFIKLKNVKVDGQPLDVGPDCRTATSASIRIKGNLPLQEGDPDSDTETRSTYTIPPFAGCGATEDLDPLLTGLVSGPGNALKTNLRLRCIATRCEQG